MNTEQLQALKRAEDAVRAINTTDHGELVPIATALDAIVKCLGTILHQTPASTTQRVQGATAVRLPKTDLEKKTF